MMINCVRVCSSVGPTGPPPTCGCLRLVHRTCCCRAPAVTAAEVAAVEELTGLQHLEVHSPAWQATFSDVLLTCNKLRALNTIVCSKPSWVVSTTDTRLHRGLHKWVCAACPCACSMRVCVCRRRVSRCIRPDKANGVHRCRSV